MKNLNLDFYKGEDKYSDGDVEQTILELVQKYPQKRLQEFDNFPTKYHLSQVRENILNWYPFDKTQTILEIGAGCGAITGALCENAKKVISVDLSKRRSTINALRHAEIENLTIMVGNLNDMVFNEKFDFVVLNGVLEYAGSFTQGKKPYHNFLQNILVHLKPEGKLLLAIENRLGLKYFAGSPEDHTCKFFDGLDNYRNSKSVRTFSKSEIEMLLKEVGLIYQKLYYPYPDYKFPYEIFTDTSLYEGSYGAYDCDFSGNDVSFFDKKNIFSALAKEKLIASFANSFLIEASKAPFALDEGVIYAKSNVDRKECFQTLTIIEKNGEKKAVKKVAANDNTVPHLANMKKTYEQLQQKPLHYLPIKLTDNNKVARFDFVDGKTLQSVLNQLIIEDNFEGAVSSLKDFFDAAFTSSKSCSYQNEKFREYFGEFLGADEVQCVNPANIDLIPNNIFLEGGKYTIIDYEWRMDIPVPIQFIKWIAINEFLSSQQDKLSNSDKQRFMQSFGISNEDSELFYRWRMHFARAYVGNNQLKDQCLPPEKIDVSQLLASRKNYAVSTLFYDQGKGFNDKQIIQLKWQMIDNGSFRVEFDISRLENIVALRFDPLEMMFCDCIIEESNVKLTPVNAVAVEGNKAVFNTIDPQYTVEFTDESIQCVEISGKILVKDTITSLFHEQEELTAQLIAAQSENINLQEEHNHLQEEHNHLQEEYNYLQEEHTHLQKVYGDIVDTKEWKTVSRMRKIKKFFIRH